MFNLRICGIIAIAAFLLSFLIGLINGTTMPLLLARPMIFAVIFFTISAAVNVLISNFMPELLEGSGPDERSRELPGEMRPGSRVDITEGDYDAPSPGASRGVAPNPLKPLFMGAQPDDN